jgi:Holliday junction resolvase-like predicted endonuclease
MDLQTFRQIIDGAPPGIAVCERDLRRLYDYVGLEHGSAHTDRAVSDALYARIRGCFTSGHSSVWRACKSLRKDLIREHVLRGAPLDPYFEVLDHLQHAIRTAGDPRASIEGDWDRAIRAAFDHVQLHSWGVATREQAHARDFMVARAARALRDAGFAIRLEPGSLRLEETAETALIAAIEDLVATMGGINVARRIFATISPSYDADQQRYHVVPHVSTSGGGVPQIPWGYLIQLAAKHAQGRAPYFNTDDQWRRLCGLSQAFAAVIDVQPYAPNFYGTMDATALMPYLQEMAVYDTLFRIPQTRPADIVRVARGMFDWLNTSAPTKAGWSIDQVLEIIGCLLDPARDVRGPIFVDEASIRRACPGVPREVATQILDEVLSHPPAGANRNFARPTDAPVPENPDLKEAGHDFFLRPLLRGSGRRFILLDRSVCAPACLEALLTPLRLETKGLDDKVGLAVERFLKEEFASHGVPTGGGDYDCGNEHGECDLVIEAPETVIFSEVKKKTLTRRAKAGSDAHLLLDLAGSLLAAQAQAGWHEVRLRRYGHLDLKRDGNTTRLELNGREVERVAVSLFDFGSFQDRTLLKQFLEATLNASFTPVAATLKKKFDEINEALVEIRKQVAALYPGQRELKQPFFNCWFLSVPQLLVLLDGVTDGPGFRAALWSCRHVVTGSSDVYFDLSKMKRWKRETAAGPPKPATA